MPRSRDLPSSTGFFSPARMRYDSSAAAGVNPGGNGAQLGSVRGSVAAVGAATARALAAEGMQVDYVAQTQTGEALGVELRDSVQGKQILLPRSDRVDDRLPAALREAGARVHEVTAYRTLRPETLDPEILGGLLPRGECERSSLPAPRRFTIWRAFVPSGGTGRAVEPNSICRDRVHHSAGAARSRCPRRDRGRTIHRRSGLADAIAKYYQRQASTVRHA